MKHTILVAATLGWLISGCSLLHVSPGSDEVSSAKKSAQANKPSRERAVARTSGDGRVQRRVGDFFVQRFSGSFSEQPLALKEEVLSRDARTIVVQYALEAGEKSTILRVSYNAKTDVPEKVSKLVNKKEEPASLADFDALMAQTVFMADSNEGLVDAQKLTCLVGEAELKCESKQYAVVVGEQVATMTVTSSKSIAGRDVAGEIKTEDGNILYRSELLEAGHQAPSSGPASVAAK